MLGDRGHEISDDFAELVGEHPVVYVPIVAAGRWLGVIIAEPEAGAAPLDERHRDLLWILGKTLALASTSRIATTVGERARELEERIDFARGIHEGVVQRLFGVSLVLSSEQPLTAEARARCAREVGAALGELRSALQRPLGRSSAPTGTTLRAELDRLCAEHADLGLSVEGPIVDVPEALEPLAQSVLTEAVRNARKHSDAKHIVVRTHIREGTLVVEIENDGVPLERAALDRRRPAARGARGAAVRRSRRVRRARARHLGRAARRAAARRQRRVVNERRRRPPLRARRRRPRRRALGLSHDARRAGLGRALPVGQQRRRGRSR